MTHKTSNHLPLSNIPDYVVINNLEQPESLRKVLRVPAEEVKFPLSIEDQRVLQLLTAAFEQEENCAGLAAPQLGFSRRMIIFKVEASEELKKLRPDLTDTMGTTIWLNPEYMPLGDEMWEDMEACFSVDDVCGPVSRYVSVKYQAYTPEGTKVTGTASGFLARVIQHEIDHLNGILFIDKIDPQKIISKAEYLANRG